MKTYILWLLVTAYCPCERCCGRQACGITADGSEAIGAIVATHRKFDFGTRMYIPEYGWAETHDRGKLGRNHIDILFPNHYQAKVWGSRWLPVTIVK